MAKKTINLTGTAGRSYDLNQIEEDNRLNANKPLIVQVYRYSKGQNPNPSDLKVGQIWLSKLVIDGGE